jgi:hypothetical protein
VQDLQLNPACSVREVLGQRVETEVDQSDAEHEDDQEDDHRVEQAVGLSWCRHEERQMVGRDRIQHRRVLVHGSPLMLSSAN